MDSRVVYAEELKRHSELRDVINNRTGLLERLFISASFAGTNSSVLRSPMETEETSKHGDGLTPLLSGTSGWAGLGF